MKKVLAILSVLFLLVVCARRASAQQVSQPFSIQLQIGDSLMPIGKPFKLPAAATPPVRVVISNVAGNSGSKFIAKEIILNSPRQMGSTTEVGRIKIPAENGSNFSLGTASTGAARFTLQYTIPTIYEVRDGKTRAISAPLGQRSFVIHYE